jgi:hypothetical protein
MGKEKVPLIVGNGLQAILQTCYENKDIKALLGIFPSVPCGHILAVLEGRARIVGDNLAGFDFVFEKGQEDE